MCTTPISPKGNASQLLHMPIKIDLKYLKWVNLIKSILYLNDLLHQTYEINFSLTAHNEHIDIARLEMTHLFNNLPLQYN